MNVFMVVSGMVGVGVIVRIRLMPCGTITTQGSGQEAAADLPGIGNPLGLEPSLGQPGDGKEDEEDQCHQQQHRTEPAKHAEKHRAHQHQEPPGFGEVEDPGDAIPCQNPKKNRGGRQNQTGDPGRTEISGLVNAQGINGSIKRK